MYVCVCNAVNDTTLVQAVLEQGLTSMRDLRQELQIGTCCGKCVSCARQILRQTLNRLPEPVAIG